MSNSWDIADLELSGVMVGGWVDQSDFGVKPNFCYVRLSYGFVIRGHLFQDFVNGQLSPEQMLQEQIHLWQLSIYFMYDKLCLCAKVQTS